MTALPAMLDPVTGRDMHEDPAPQVPREHRLPAGARVSATVLCHHPWGVGIRLADSTQDGHVDVPFIRDGPVRGPQDYPPVGQAMPAVVIRYSGTGQLRLSMRPSDITGNS
jgi:predicted RNA-binding protein with RPS1 domain